MNFNSTVKGSALEGFYPAGWDFDKIDACIDAPETITNRQSFWNDGFTPIQCNDLGEFETYMGHEIAMQIKLAKEKGITLQAYSCSQCSVKHFCSGYADLYECRISFHI